MFDRVVCGYFLHLMYNIISSLSQYTHVEYQYTCQNIGHYSVS